MEVCNKKGCGRVLTMEIKVLMKWASSHHVWV